MENCLTPKRTRKTRLPDWNSSKTQELPPEVDPKKLERACTPGYYLLPDNLTLHSSYWTKLGRSILNDTLVCSVSGMESSKHKATNGYETSILYCEEDMRCIEKLYDDDPELDDLLESQNNSYRSKLAPNVCGFQKYEIMRIDESAHRSYERRCAKKI